MNHFFTITLLRPDFIADEYGKEVQTFVVQTLKTPKRCESLHVAEAVKSAQNEFCELDAHDTPEDYHCISVFVGIHENLKP